MVDINLDCGKYTYSPRTAGLPQLHKQYFSKLNPIAEKIMNDIENIKSVYCRIWYSLSPSEQNGILDETLIKSELSIKYESQRRDPNKSGVDSLSNINAHASISNNGIENKINVRQFYNFDGQNLKTFVIQKTVYKQDESGKYFDEHSLCPYNYRTKSQMNLAFYTLDTSSYTTPNLHISRFYEEKQRNNQHDNKYINSEKKCETPSFNAKTKGIVGKFLDCDYNKKNYQHKQVEVEDATRTTENEPTALCNLKTTSKLSKYNSTNIFQSPLLDQISFNRYSHGLSGSNMSYVDSYLINTENANLIRDYSSSGNLTTSSPDSSDGNLCENVKLLVSDIDIRKGFDFLNNW